MIFQREARDQENVRLDDFLKMGDSNPVWDASLRKINEQLRIQDDMKAHMRNIIGNKLKKESFLQ